MTRRRSLVALVLGLALAFGLVPGVQSPAARAYPTANVIFEGHGWGHGRGMGQYGALGYAVNHGWDWQRILKHYYSNTNDAGIPEGDGLGLFVRVSRLDNRDLIVLDPTGANAGATGFTGRRKAFLIQRSAAGQFSVRGGDSCAGPWGPAVLVNGRVTVSSFGPSDGVSTKLETCEAVGNRVYRGDLVAFDSGGARTANGTLFRWYLRGVVPAESPAGWGTLGGGAGMNALRAQSVAARSYTYARFKSPRVFPDICDTEQCQVYYGVGIWNAGHTAFTSKEATTTNNAIDQTAGRIRRMMSDNRVASTEFSSSTGGRTAGGNFPSVVDDGDSISSNPNHNWRKEVPVSTVQSKYPSIGTLHGISVTERSTFDGVRAKTVVLRGSSGSVTVTGDALRIALGLKSSWFNVVGSASGGLNGYWVLASDGGIFSFGKAVYHGSMTGQPLNKPIVAMAATPTGNGYWLVASDGGIFSYGDAVFHGSTGGIALVKPIVGITPTPSGKGYWLVASDGGIFSFGDAAGRFYGSMGGKPLNKPIVGMTRTSTGNGYWMVASDGGIFSFGDAANRFYGSTGGMALARPIIGMQALPNDSGYWLFGQDGGIFAFNAPYYGSLPERQIVGTAVGVRRTATGKGYEIAMSNGDVEPFGDAPDFGDAHDQAPAWTGRAIGIEVKPGS